MLLDEGSHNLAGLVGQSVVEPVVDLGVEVFNGIYYCGHVVDQGRRIIGVNESGYLSPRNPPPPPGALLRKCN